MSTYSRKSKYLIHIDALDFVETFRKCLSNETKIPKFVAFGFTVMPSDDFQSVAMKIESLRGDLGG